MTPALDRIRIVLVEPLYGGNIGQVSRAMLNFGLRRLVLVNPREHRTAESYWMARDGKEIMDAAEVHPSLEAALAAVGLAVGTTRRVGKYRRPAMDPESCARDLAPLTRENDVAIVFGREDSGLTAEELKLCQWLVTIPANPEFPSLNLAQAVLLMGSTLYRSTLAPASEAAAGAGIRLAGPAELERLYQHLEETLGAIGFLTGDHAPSILISLRRIFGRANLESRDVAILRGVLGQMDWYRKNSIGPAIHEGRRAVRSKETAGPGIAASPGSADETLE
jgi:tRNA/rRNA methyltransferase